MRFLPSENIIFKTRLTEEAVIQRLTSIIEPESKFLAKKLGGSSTKLYKGRVKGLTFNMRRIIHYRSGSLPNISGVIKNGNNGVTIHVKMELQDLKIGLMYFNFGAVGLWGIISLLQAFKKSEFGISVLIPFGLMLFAYAITMGEFKIESKKSRSDLQKILEAEILEE